MRTTATIKLREIVRRSDPALAGVRALYERSIGAAERIPWEWIEHPIREPSPQGRRYHLLVAQNPRKGRRGPVLGFVTGMFLPNFGGYLSYVAVDPRARGRGIGARLYRGMIRRLRRTAEEADQTLPFMLWDSRPPSPSDGPEVRENWESRLHLFKKIGGRWIEGIQFTSPNYLNPRSGDVPLEFFLRAIDDDRSEFSSGRLRRIVRGLLRRVYYLDLDSPQGELLREYAPLRLAAIK